MKRIIISLLTLGIVGVVAVGATTAIFSDEEVSTGNTFTAGAIDLTVDNESYYNGVLNASTTWLVPANLDDGQGPADGLYLFFDYDDLKPGDWGEDTISLHVNNNDSWLCVDVTLTSDNDNGCTEPEGEDGDVTCDDPGPGQGELDDAIDFIWWADDGDNVFEDDEVLLPAGPLGNLAVDETATVALADSNVNIWDGTGPLTGGETHYIGKAWCFGNLTPTPVAQDDQTDVLDPTQVTGFDCDGAPVNNVTQTDSMTADIAFRAEQARNNGGFLCEPPIQEEIGTLTIIKNLVNDNAGNAVEEDFTFDVTGDGVNDTGLTSGSSILVAPGEYSIVENGPDGYSTSFSASCTGGVASVVNGEETICIITNDDIPPAQASLTLDKQVSFTGPTLDVSTTDFVFSIYFGGELVATTTDMQSVVLAPGDYEITEEYVGGTPFNFSTIYSGLCTDAATSTVTLVADADVTCPVINSEQT